MGLTETSWHGIHARKLEDDALSVVIVPELGAKIASIYDKKAEREWLLGPIRAVRPAPYAASYIEYDVSGWDEMFPTILACPYPTPGKYQGAALPDHGEVWALPWHIDEANGAKLALSVEGRAIPYRLKRTASLMGGGRLKLHYEAVNLSDEVVPYLWAAHPLFAVDESTRIVLPPEVREVYNVFDMPLWGKAGTRYPWPQATLQNGQAHWLNRIGPVSIKDNHKFFVPPEVRIGWAALHHAASGTQLRLDWTQEQVPYLGVWVDEGAYIKEPTAALEPGSAFYDGLDIAWKLNQYRTLAPHGSAEWDVIVSVSSDGRASA